MCMPAYVRASAYYVSACAIVRMRELCACLYRARCSPLLKCVFERCGDVWMRRKIYAGGLPTNMNAGVCVRVLCAFVRGIVCMGERWYCAVFCYANFMRVVSCLCLHVSDLFLLCPLLFPQMPLCVQKP